MRLSHESITDCLGPGNRYVIWMQGCAKKCAGCINPEGQALDGGYEKSIDDIACSILGTKDIIGITISGGEPFLQYKELYDLLKRIRLSSNLDVMVYTGYTYEELYEKHKDGLFSLIDILVDGEYHEEMNTGSALRGSDNQRIIFLSPKYKAFGNELLNSKNRKFSIDITKSGDIYFVGIPPKNFYRQFLEKLGGTQI